MKNPPLMMSRFKVGTVYCVRHNNTSRICTCSICRGRYCCLPFFPISPRESFSIMATDVQGLDVVLRVELLDAQRQPLSLFHDAGVKVDVADDYAVLVGVRQALYLAEKSERDEVIPPNGNAGDAPAEATTANLATTPAVHLSDGHELQLDEDEMVTDVKWIEHDHFCASYSSGTIRILNRQGKLVFEQVRRLAHVMT